MSKKTKFGKCKLCGRETELTFEHVPPEKAFNSYTVKNIGFEETVKLITGENGRMPWDLTGLKGKYNQKGAGDYYLCEECNNNTGSWYMSEYVGIAKELHNLIQREKFLPGDICGFEMNIYPLRLFKAVMTMFCDINHDCFGDESLRNFLLNKESTDFPSDKYKVYMNLISPAMCRIHGIAVMLIGNKSIITNSEILRYPIGFSLFIDKPDEFKPKGVLINDYATVGYDERYRIHIGEIPYLEINSQIPLNFRSKDELKRIIEESNDG